MAAVELPEVHECDIVYAEGGVRHVHTFHRHVSYKEGSTPSDFKAGKVSPVLLVAEHRISKNIVKFDDEDRLVRVSCDGVRFVIEVAILPDRKYFELGEFSRFDVKDTTMLEKLVCSLTTGKQDPFWDRVRIAIERTKG
jgi:hypothetical protein